MRRLRMCLASHPREASVAVRPYYEGLPSMAGRGAKEGGESRRIRDASLRARKHGSESTKRRSGAPKGAASSSRCPRCARRASQACTVQRDLFGAPFGAPLPGLRGQP